MTSPPSPPAITARGLRRSYGDTVVLERFDLADVAGKGAATYSGGLHRRLDIAMMLMGAPRRVAGDPRAG